MFVSSRRLMYGAVLFGSLALVGAGYSASARSKLPASLRPAPAATSVIGTTTGPLFYVQNNGTSAFNTYGVTGVAGVGPYAIGVLGYGANGSAPNIALTGYDIGPGSVASVGEATYAEPSTGGPGSTQTTGVLGLAPDGDGVMGQTSVVHGCCYSDYLPSVSNYAGMVGVDNSTNSGFNAGVVGKTSSGLYGVEGISSNDAIGGVEGIGTTGDGVDAFSEAGIGLFAYSAAGYGMYAESGGTSPAALLSATEADGLDATTSQGCCVHTNFTAAVYGDATGTNATGVVGTATSSTSNSFAIYAFGASTALGGQGTTSGALLLSLFNSAGSNVARIDSSGNLFLNGSVTAAAATQGGAVSRSYVPKSTMQTIEDFGNGMLTNGSGVVRIDPTFAQMSDGTGYEVFLTPKGDSNGLYIAQENATSFVVRESRSGHSTLAFDYRIVAKQYGHSTDRATIAASAEAFGAPRVRPASVTSQTAALAQRATPRHAVRTGTAPYNTFAIPRAVSGLSLNLGR